MPKSRVKRFFLAVLGYMRILIVAWMVGIANCVNQDHRFMDDTNYKIEVQDKQSDDDPFE